MRRAVAISALALLTSGCAIPGSNIDGEAKQAQNNAQSVQELSQKLAITAITPELIREQTKPIKPQRINPELEQAIARYDYRVGAGDVLNITVWDHPELTIPAGSYRSAQDAGNWVHNDGTIYYPYVGNLKVTGLLVTEIRDMLAQRLSRYIEKPQVDVSVAAFRSQRVYITGEVANATKLAITNVPLTLLDAISSAGGLTIDADWDSVLLSRDGVETVYSFKDLYERGDLTQNTLLRHNDVVHVARNDGQKVFVLGEVVTPQPVTILRHGMTLAEALATSGGLNENKANASGVFVIRANPEGAEQFANVYQMNIKDARAMVFADQFRLHARDIVYVTAEPVALWNRVLSQLLPTVAAINAIANISDTVNDLWWSLSEF